MGRVSGQGRVRLVERRRTQKCEVREKAVDGQGKAANRRVSCSTLFKRAAAAGGWSHARRSEQRAVAGGGGWSHARQVHCGWRRRRRRRAVHRQGRLVGHRQGAVNSGRRAAGGWSHARQTAPSSSAKPQLARSPTISSNPARREPCGEGREGREGEDSERRGERWWVSGWPVEGQGEAVGGRWMGSGESVERAVAGQWKVSGRAVDGQWKGQWQGQWMASGLSRKRVAAHRGRAGHLNTVSAQLSTTGRPQFGCQRTDRAAERSEERP